LHWSGLRDYSLQRQYLCLRFLKGRCLSPFPVMQAVLGLAGMRCDWLRLLSATVWSLPAIAVAVLGVKRMRTFLRRLFEAEEVSPGGIPFYSICYSQLYYC